MKLLQYYHIFALFILTLLFNNEALNSATPERSPWGQGMTRWADYLFVQEQLRDLQITESAFAHHPAILGSHPETPNQEPYDSAWKDMEEEDEGNATSLLDAKLDTNTGEKWMPLGTRIPQFQLIGTTEGIVPCVESITNLTGNSANLGIDE